VFQAPGEPAIYWLGDTIYYDLVDQVIREFRPSIAS